MQWLAGERRVILLIMFQGCDEREALNDSSTLARNVCLPSRIRTDSSPVQCLRSAGPPEGALHTFRVVLGGCRSVGLDLIAGDVTGAIRGG